MAREVFLDNAFNLSQDRSNVIGIWWYQIRTGILEYSVTATGHLDVSVFTLQKVAQEDRSVIRGRLIRVNDFTYCVCFIGDMIGYNKDMLADLRDKLSVESQILIDFVVDDYGVLLESVLVK